MYRTEEMMQQLIKAVKEAGYESIIAPYEADAQLAYMARNRLVAGVLTNDADLVAYGVLLYSDLILNADILLLGVPITLFPVGRDRSFDLETGWLDIF